MRNASVGTSVLLTELSPGRAVLVPGSEIAHSSASMTLCTTLAQREVSRVTSDNARHIQLHKLYMWDALSPSTEGAGAVRVTVTVDTVREGQKARRAVGGAGLTSTITSTNTKPSEKCLPPFPWPVGEKITLDEGPSRNTRTHTTSFVRSSKGVARRYAGAGHVELPPRNRSSVRRHKHSRSHPGRIVAQPRARRRGRQDAHRPGASSATAAVPAFNYVDLPFELMSQIFLECMEDCAWDLLDMSSAPWTFSRVSKYWRTVVLGEARLWSRFCVRFITPHRLVALEIALQRTKAPLTIEFLENRWNSEFCEAVRMLAECSERWHRVYVYVPHDGDTAIFDAVKGRLENLQILHMFSRRVLSVFSESPNLRCLSLFLRNPASFNPCWSGLTTFTCIIEGPDDLLPILAETRSLARLHICPAQKIDDLEGFPRRKTAEWFPTVTLESLTDLTIQTHAVYGSKPTNPDSGTFLSTLLSAIVAPALTHLAMCCGQTEDATNVANIVSFVCRSRCFGLLSFSYELRSGRLDGSILEALRVMPELRQLSLQGVPGDSLFDDLLCNSIPVGLSLSDMTVSASLHDGRSTVPPILPRLETLIVNWECERRVRCVSTSGMSPLSQVMVQMDATNALFLTAQISRIRRNTEQCHPDNKSYSGRSGSRIEEGISKLSSDSEPTSLVVSIFERSDGSSTNGANYFFGFLVTFFVLLLMFIACGIGSRRRWTRAMALAHELERTGGLPGQSEPRMTEIWLSAPDRKLKDGDGGGVQWEAIMPAGVAVDLAEPTASSSSPASMRHEGARWRTLLNRLSLHRRHPPRQVKEVVPDACTDDIESNVPVVAKPPPPRTVHVAVMISMPSPPSSHPSSSSAEVSQEAGDVTRQTPQDVAEESRSRPLGEREFEIGVCSVVVPSFSID
ncbi:hypothetical protein FISHEDRAFT_55373 [Fistulina hepatica ATCC 64428]|uniref:Uncharacterized protein n=1 Tax=Fistulina hepatica ATCC 64428 TaxID=1128425 RepID=A0A0D7ANI8_9AGAR|nr:hypothetical protein FISHEDRAFT_55373 [Fistulina hepatica ATCC 64428]